MALTDSQYDRLVRVARAHGSKAGSAAATWRIDGNTPDETCAALLRMIDDDDPEFFDSIPNPLAGEWADDPSHAQIIAEAIDASDQPDDLMPSDLTDIDTVDVLDAWESGYRAGYVREVRAEAIARLA